MNVVLGVSDSITNTGSKKERGEKSESKMMSKREALRRHLYTLTSFL